MADTRAVYFHVGGHKTGTTFLQNVMWHNRAALRRDGLLYPGDHRNAHVWANHDLRNANFKGYRAPQVDGAWTRLVTEIRDWGGPAVIDHEMFSLAAQQHIARAMRDLSFADVHIVFTARDMARQLPAVWQEWLKNRETLRYSEFLHAVQDEHTEQSKRLRALHDVPAILAKWSAGLPPEHVHVVTVPRPGAEPGLLWQRFAGVIGVDPSRYDTDIPGTNSSLGAAEAAVIRRLNEVTADVPQPRYDRAVKFHLAGRLARRPGSRIDLPEHAYEWAVQQSQGTVAALRGAGYDIVGDLDELVPTTRPQGADPDAVDAGELADAAIASIAALLELPISPASGAKQAAELSRGRREVREDAALSPVRRLRRTGSELADQVRWLGAARNGYRRLHARRG